MIMVESAHKRWRYCRQHDSGDLRLEVRPKVMKSVTVRDSSRDMGLEVNTRGISTVVKTTFDAGPKWGRDELEDGHVTVCFLS